MNIVLDRFFVRELQDKGIDLSYNYIVAIYRASRVRLDRQRYLNKKAQEEAYIANLCEELEI